MYRLKKEFQGKTIAVNGIKIDGAFLMGSNIAKTIELFPAVGKFIEKVPTKKA